jgi:hypothetical protein
VERAIDDESGLDSIGALCPADMHALPDRPRSVGQTLDDGVRLFRRAFASSLSLSLFANALIGVPILLAADVTTAAGLRFIVVMVLGWTLSLAFFSALSYRLWGIATGADPGFAASTRRGFACLPALLMALLLYLLAVAAGLILLIIPGIMLSVSLFFYSLVIVLEGDGPARALGASHRLVRGDWWRTAAVLSVAFAVVMIMQLGADALTLLWTGVDLDADAYPATEDLLSTIVSVLASTVTGPLFAAVMIVLYHDLGLRRRGEDLRRRIEALAMDARHA